MHYLKLLVRHTTSDISVENRCFTVETDVNFNFTDCNGYSRLEDGVILFADEEGYFVLVRARQTVSCHKRCLC